MDVLTSSDIWRLVHATVSSLTNFAAYFHRRCVLRPKRLLALLFEPPHARVHFTGYGSRRPMSTFDQSVTFRWGSRVDSVRFRVHFSRPGQRSKLKNSFRQDLTSAKVSIFRRSVACVKHFLFLAVPVDVPVRWSGFLERGRPRPLNPPLMQTQPVLVWLERRARCIRSLGLMVPQADEDVRAPVNPFTFTVGIQDHTSNCPTYRLK